MVAQRKFPILAGNKTSVTLNDNLQMFQVNSKEWSTVFTAAKTENPVMISKMKKI
jgi:hypothetical protein